MMLNAAVVVLFGIAMLVFAFFEIRSYRSGFRDFKSLIVSLGLLGTFVGILLGLWDFDTRQISASVPGLLEGLKTAFVTSVFGMFLSIVLGAYEAFRRPEEAAEDAPSEPEDLEALRREVSLLGRQSLQLAEERHRETLHQLKKGFEGLRLAMEHSGSKAVIEALRKTMEDFNERLLESFGGNFRALDRSVGKMVQWQESYRRDVEAFEAALRRTAEVTRDSSEELREIFETVSREYRAAFETLSAELRQNSDRNLEVIRASAAEVYRNFDELLKMQQHLESVAKSYERMAEAHGRTEGLPGTQRDETA